MKLLLEMKGNVLGDYQLKNEWTQVSTDQNTIELIHRYSKEAALHRTMLGTAMRHLHHFAARETYSFPYCPRVYKCTFITNYCTTGNEMLVDVSLLYQKLMGSFAELDFHPDRKKLVKKIEGQLVQLAEGFEYLFRRFGPFLVNERLISWNSCGMVKVWLNKDPLSQQIQSRLETENQMVESLVKVLQSTLQLRFWDGKSIATFERLVNCVENGQYDKIRQSSRKVTFRAHDGQCSVFQCTQSNKLLQLSKSINTNSVTSNDSIGGQQRSVKKLPQVTFQFDLSKQRGRLSSERSGRRRMERSLTQKQEERGWTLTLGGEKGDGEKQNQEPILKKSKTQTQVIINPTEKRHSRRYSNTIQHQQPPNKLFHTHDCFPKRRKSSLLRMELQSDLDELFHQSEEQLSFDAGELQRELQDVL